MCIAPFGHCAGMTFSACTFKNMPGADTGRPFQRRDASQAAKHARQRGRRRLYLIIVGERVRITERTIRENTGKGQTPPLSSGACLLFVVGRKVIKRVDGLRSNV